MVQESVEGFREHMAKLQNMKGLTSEEKGVVMYNLYVWIQGCRNRSGQSSHGLTSFDS